LKLQQLFRVSHFNPAGIALTAFLVALDSQSEKYQHKSFESLAAVLS
jgi:hypothetical protein